MPKLIIMAGCLHLLCKNDYYGELGDPERFQNQMNTITLNDLKLFNHNVRLYVLPSSIYYSRMHSNVKYGYPACAL